MKKLCVIPVLIAACAFGQQGISPTINDFPSRQFGQPANSPAFNQPLNSAAANLVEGRELNAPYALAFDTSVSPPILYIADTGNNRVLAFKNPNNLSKCGISAPTCGFADLVIGQRDLNSTLQGGPLRQGLSSGFAFPTSVAVDAGGNLYVLDTGNNRILRFPAPFKQTASPLITDLVIGQKTVNSGTQPNEGNGATQPDQTTLSFAAGAPAALALDPSGNLWVSDFGNNRVLRFPVAQLTANTILPQANLVLGQFNFTTNTLPNTGNTSQALFKGLLYEPTAMTFDASGNLYVTDSPNIGGRVLYFTAPFQANGQSATRILGLCEGLNQTVCANPTLNGYTLNNPSGLFSDGTHLFVIDAGNNRVAMYDTPSAWPAPPNPGVVPQVAQDSPPIKAVIGQASPTSGGKPNKKQPEPDATTFSFPIVAGGGAFNGTDMWVADLGNNRVLGFPLVSGSYVSATHLVGQLDYQYFQPNLIEGRELFLTATNATGNATGGDVAIDHSSNPPHLYIADTYNNRILGFLDARKVQPGVRADIVIGQSDISGQPGTAFYRALANNPLNDPTLAQQTGLSLPSGVIVDAAGNLWVADSGNARVLRFPAPFAPANAAQTPNVVLGQQNFTSNVTDPSQAGMRYPYGLALFSNGSLAVSDAALNRITIFKRPAGGDFTSSVPADVVLGQVNFTNIGSSSGNAGLNVPRHIGVDTSDRLYVADSNNSRMVAFNNPLSAGNGVSSSIQINNIYVPQGIAVSPATGEIWITLGDSIIWRLPEYDALSLLSNPNAPPYTQQLNLATVPFSIALDNSNNLIVAEQANRVTFYYPKLTYQHAATYSGGLGNNYVTPLAPGQLALLYQLGQDFNLQPNMESSNPWPTTMSDLQITVNGTPAPIYRVDTTDIAFQVPSGTPPTGTANFLVTHPSTGEIIAAGSFPMAQYNPGFFTGGSGTGQIAAINEDGTINSAAHPVSRDGTQYISFYLTGGGLFDGGGGGAPPLDGYAPANAANTHDRPEIIMGAFGALGIAPDNLILYSGAGAFAGGWQINFTVSNLIPPGVQTIVVQIGGIKSNIGPTNQPNSIFLTFVTK